jgi:hypothetical protein
MFSKGYEAGKLLCPRRDLKAGALCQFRAEGEKAGTAKWGRCCDEQEQRVSGGHLNRVRMPRVAQQREKFPSGNLFVTKSRHPRHKF